MTDNTKVTELELKILQQIWEKNSAVSVAQIIDLWPDQVKPGYTTILKTLQKMEQKNIVGHKPDGRKYKYFAVVEKEKVIQNRLSSIIDRVFGKSKLSFAEYFVRSNDFSADELKQLKSFIEEKEKESN